VILDARRLSTSVSKTAGEEFAKALVSPLQGIETSHPAHRR
jgi:hypothetical protein